MRKFIIFILFALLLLVPIEAAASPLAEVSLDRAEGGYEVRFCFGGGLPWRFVWTDGLPAMAGEAVRTVWLAPTMEGGLFKLFVR